MSELAYLSCPYNDPSPEVRAFRFKKGSEIAATLMRDGIFVLCGISHVVPLMNEGLPKEWPHWEGYDRALVERCSRVIVVKMAGWESSRGVQTEIRIATEAGIPIEYMDV